MAKKKNLSKNKQAELLRKQGYTYKQINRMDSETRQKISNLIISDKEDKKKGITAPKSDNKTQRALQRANRITRKRFELEKQGFTDAMKRGKISDRQIDSINLKDIESGRINRENYPFLYYNTKFDFDKVYRLKNGKRMYIAFRDYQGELDIEDAMREFSRYSNDELLTFLEGIVETPPSYQKGIKGSSSGKAGAFKFVVAQQNVINIFNNETYNESRKYKRRKESADKGKRRSKRQQYKGDNVGFQVIKDGARVSHDEVTPRNLLIMANAICYNVTEQDRVAFYKRFYTDITRSVPDMAEVLPKPKY